MSPTKIAATAMALKGDEQATFVKRWNRSWSLGTWHHLQHVIDWRVGILHGGCPEDDGPELFPIIVLRVFTSAGRELERFYDDLDRDRKRAVLLPQEVVAAFVMIREHLRAWVKRDGASPYPEPPPGAQTSVYVAADVDRRHATS
jgi:hypothetical protein